MKFKELKSLKYPKDWRIGQTIENFKRWLVVRGRDGDLFYYEDEELKELYREFLKSLK